MDLSKLGTNERAGLYGAIAVVLAGILSNWGGLLLLAILAAIGMAIVVLLPQLSSGTALPGSKGSFMAVLGFVAAAVTIITLLQWVSVLAHLGLNAIMLLVALVGALVMAWAGWQELQAEGGRWRFGTADRTPTAASDAGVRSEPVQEDAPEPDEPSPASGRTEA